MSVAREQASELLDDDGVREKVLGFWDEVNAWHGRLGTKWWPADGSDLLGDNDAASAASPAYTPSFSAWTSLAVGTDCLLTASAYCLNFGPTLFSMQPLLRSAVLGGAQAVWLLESPTREERLKRARKVAADSHWNHKLWAHGLTGAHPEAIDHDVLPNLQKTLDDLAGDQRRPEVNATRVVARAAEVVYNAPPDPQIAIDVLANWRSMSGVAHALPWELNTRAGGASSDVDGRRTMAHPASWSELQGAFGTAYAFLDTGWRLLDRRSTAAERP